MAQGHISSWCRVGHIHKSWLSHTYTYHLTCTSVPNIGLRMDCNSWFPLLLSYLLHTGEVTCCVLGPFTHQILLTLAVLDWQSGPFEVYCLSCHNSWLLAIIIWGIVWVETSILALLQAHRIGGFVMPAGPQDCSLAGEISVIKQGSSKPLTWSSYKNTRVTGWGLWEHKGKPHQ
jgi:hypothetical protein